MSGNQMSTRAIAREPKLMKGIYFATSVSRKPLQPFLAAAALFAALTNESMDQTLILLTAAIILP
jgi:hypothetical protein